jgi:phosphoglycerate kinase
VVSASLQRSAAAIELPVERATLEGEIDALLGEFGHKPFTLIGGGDTVGYVEGRKLVKSFGHVSTGGGASLELMGGRTLPGVEALENKK